MIVFRFRHCSLVLNTSKGCTEYSENIRCGSNSGRMTTGARQRGRRISDSESPNPLFGIDEYVRTRN